MTNGLLIFLYDFAPDPIWISLYIRNILFSFLLVSGELGWYRWSCYNNVVNIDLIDWAGRIYVIGPACHVGVMDWLFSVV